MWEVLRGERPIRKLFSKEQRAFYEAHAPAGIALDDLSILGPIFVLKLKWVAEDFARPMVAEAWLYPDASMTLELSTKALPAPGLPGRGGGPGLPRGQGHPLDRGPGDEDQARPAGVLEATHRRRARQARRMTVTRPRPARRAIDELSLVVEPSILETHAAAEPAWLTADRRSAFDAWTALPAEANLLYTPYIDLRAARLDAAELVLEVPAGAAAGTLPDDAAALLEITDGAVTAAVLSEAAAAAGVTLTDLSGLLAREPDRARAMLLDGPGVPADDKFAQLTRATWAQGAVVDVPAGVRLDRPIVIRWAIGLPDRALVTRSLVRIGDDADVAIVEELVPSAAADERAAQSFFAGTMEVTARREGIPAGLRPAGAAGERGRDPASCRGGRARRRRSGGRSPSSAAGSSGAGSTIGSWAIAARSNRSRSCSAAPSSSST